jgi:hypothetical protein
MFKQVYSFLGSKEENAPPPVPPPVAITGVRIPADGTPAHLLPLTTTSDYSGGTDDFLFHIPDLQHYWTPERAWELRDSHRLDLRLHAPQQHELRQQHDLQQMIMANHGTVPIHVRQRHLHEQQYYLLQQCYASCKGTYYVFYSFAVDYLPQNLFAPAWIREFGNGHYHNYYGDAFLVKLAPNESDDHDWAVYEDILPEFLNVLATGPSRRLEKYIRSRHG